MSGFSETAVLVHVTYAEGKNGRQLPESTRKRVFVNPFSVSAASFNVADAEGMRPRHLLQMRACDYHGEETIEYRGEALAITDVSRGGRDEFVRLTCSQKVADDG